jgi:hypothetical protein
MVPEEMPGWASKGEYMSRMIFADNTTCRTKAAVHDNVDGAEPNKRAGFDAKLTVDLPNS